MFPKIFEAFIPPMLAMAESQFPRVCNACQHPYRNFKQFVQETKPIGAPTITLDAETDPIGMMSWTNCACGSTLIVSCERRDEGMHNEFTRVLKAEAQASGLPIEDLLLAIRAEVRRRMLKDNQSDCLLLRLRPESGMLIDSIESSQRRLNPFQRGSISMDEA